MRLTILVACLLLATPNVLAVGVTLTPTDPVKDEISNGVDLAVSNVNLAEDATVVVPTGVQLGLMQGLLLNWDWRISIWVPIVDAVDPNIGNVEQVREWLSGLVPDTTCEYDTLGLVGPYLSNAFLSVDDDQPVRASNSEASKKLCDSEWTEVSLEFDSTTYAQPITDLGGEYGVNAPDIGSIHAPYECEEIHHENGWKKDTYEHVRTGSAEVNTFLLQGHLVGNSLKGFGDGRCGNQHGTLLEGWAGGAILIAVPVTGWMSVDTNGGEVDLGPLGGGKVDVYASVDFDGYLDIPVVGGHVRVDGYGYAIGA